MVIQYERNHDGAWILYASTDHGQLITRTYYGYSKTQAIQQHKQLMKLENNQ